MRIAFDLDGTVADMQKGLAREARRLFPAIDPATLPRSTSPTDSSLEEDDTPTQAEVDEPEPSLSLDQHRKLWAAIHERENFWETLDEIEPGALVRLAQVSIQRKWELVFLTSRPETKGRTAQDQSHRWLVAHGVPSPSVFVVHGSRGRIAAALQLDVVVDDRPQSCVDVAVDSGARPILVWRGDESSLPHAARLFGISIVGSVAECLDVLEAFDGRIGELSARL